MYRSRSPRRFKLNFHNSVILTGLTGKLTNNAQGRGRVALRTPARVTHWHFRYSEQDAGESYRVGCQCSLSYVLEEKHNSMAMIKYK